MSLARGFTAFQNVTQSRQPSPRQGLYVASLTKWVRLMSAVKKTTPISVEDYLAGELVSSVKHEYLGGAVYAMAGANNTHTLIASNILGLLFSQLRGRRCRALNSDAKIRIPMATHTRFYYPDASVVCQPNRPSESFQESPIIIVEVLSKGTRRTDEGEKMDAYLKIPALTAYVLVEQVEALVTVWRRIAEGFERELYVGLDATISFADIDVTLSMAEIYESVEFVPEADDDEDQR